MIHEIAGIDYGRGITNVDLETGIRYGAISLNSVSPEFLREFEEIYPENLSEKELGYCGPIAYTYKDEAGLVCEYSPDSYFLWVFKSPVTVECKFCSPCVPGAGDLNNPVEGGVKTYGLPSDCLYKEEI